MLKGNNFFAAVLAGIAVIPKDYNGSSTAGATISEPWKLGRQITFVAIGGAHASSATMTCKVQGLKRSDGTTWEALKESDGTTDLAFTASKLADAGEIENGVILGTIPLSKIDGDVYKAIRLAPVGSAHAQIFGASYFITDLIRHPSTQTDDIWDKISGLGA